MATNTEPRDTLRDFDPNKHIPLHTDLATLEVITKEQRDRLYILSNSFKAADIRVGRDSFNNLNVLFSMSSNGVHIISGLIEPSGQAHT